MTKLKLLKDYKEEDDLLGLAFLWMNKENLLPTSTSSSDELVFLRLWKTAPEPQAAAPSGEIPREERPLPTRPCSPQALSSPLSGLTSGRRTSSSSRR